MTPTLRFERLLWLLWLVVTCALFAPMMVRWTQMDPSDYAFHNPLAQQVVEAPAEFFANMPHFLYHVLVAIPYSLSEAIDTNLAAAITLVLFYIVLLAVTYAYLRARAGAILTTRRGILIVGLLALGLLIVAPVNFLTPDTLYFGYYAPHVYHNPTVNIMKPFAVALFALCGLVFYRKDRLNWRWLLGYAVLTVLSIFAKPNFIIALLPALALLTGLVMLRTLPRFVSGGWRGYTTRIWRVINWPILLGGIVLPAGAVLYVQTITWTSGAGIAIEPFRTQLEWSFLFDPNANQWLLVKVILSALFPLVVYGLHLRTATRDVLFNLGWLVYAVGVGMTLLLIEVSDLSAGNFGWSAQGGVLVLFIAAAGFLVKRYQATLAGTEENNATAQWRLWLAVVVFGVHVACGFYWYGLHLTQDFSQLLTGAW